MTSTNFNQLTQRGQTSRLRKLATVMLPHYDLAGAKLRLLRYYTNAIYRVAAADGTRYALRLLAPGNASDDALRSEMIWLQHLRGEGLAVPSPVVTLDGATFVREQVAGVPESRQAVLFEWLPGRSFPDDGALPPLPIARKSGAFLAAMHNAADRFQPPPGFTRPRIDWGLLFGPDQPMGDGRFATFGGEDRQTMVDRAAAVVEQAMAELNAMPGNFGMIHADYYPSNYLLYKGQIQALDFEDCSWGHYLFDIAGSLFGDPPTIEGAAFKDALLEGYASTRPLPKRFAELLPAFIVARAAYWLNWLVASDNPALRDYAPRGVAWATNRIKEALEL